MNYWCHSCSLAVLAEHSQTQHAIFTHPQVVCKGKEMLLGECAYTWKAKKLRCSSKRAAVVQCFSASPPPPNPAGPLNKAPIRLAASHPYVVQSQLGRLEINLGSMSQGAWVTACADGFDDKAAHVACKQMGQAQGVAFGTNDDFMAFAFQDPVRPLLISKVRLGRGLSWPVRLG